MRYIVSTFKPVVYILLMVFIVLFGIEQFMQQKYITNYVIAEGLRLKGIQTVDMICFYQALGNDFLRFRNLGCFDKVPYIVGQNLYINDIADVVFKKAGYTNIQSISLINNITVVVGWYKEPTQKQKKELLVYIRSMVELTKPNLIFQFIGDIYNVKKYIFTP